MKPDLLVDSSLLLEGSFRYKISISRSDSIIDVTTTTLTSEITAQAASIVGWNVQPTQSPTSNPITSQINPSLPSANGYRMSDSAKVGIGVSVGIGTLIGIALIAWTIILTRRNRNLSANAKISKKPQTSSRTDSRMFEIPSQPCELCGSQSNELGGEHINELNHHRSLCELDPVTVPVEMSVATPKMPSAQWPSQGYTFGENVCIENMAHGHMTGISGLFLTLI